MIIDYLPENLEFSIATKIMIAKQSHRSYNEVATYWQQRISEPE